VGPTILFDRPVQKPPPPRLIHFPVGPAVLWASAEPVRWVQGAFKFLNRREIEGFRCDLKKVFNEDPAFWDETTSALSERLDESSEMRTMKFKHDTLKVQCIIPKHAKNIIDKIDAQLAKHYSLTDDELDFLLNYDFKYRVGMELGDEAVEATAKAN
jgi:hypothetical protein